MLDTADNLERDNGQSFYHHNTLRITANTINGQFQREMAVGNISIVQSPFWIKRHKLFGIYILFDGHNSYTHK